MSPQKEDVSPERIAAITGAVRALSVIHNTAASFGTAHAMFGRTVTERFPAFERVLADAGQFQLLFKDGQVQYATVTVEPGSRIFQDLAQHMNALGVTGLSFTSALTPDELIQFVTIIVEQGDALPGKGLQKALQEAGIKSIKEEKLKLVSAKAKTTRSKKKAESDKGAEKFDPKENLERIRRESRNEPFKGFVSTVLGTFRKKQATAAQAAEAINSEYEDRLSIRIDQVRKEYETKIRRLTTIKDLVLKELQNLNLAAIVLDSDLNVLASNEPSVALLGHITRVDRDTPLEAFVRSGRERGIVTVGSEDREARLIMSVADDKDYESMMLITIE